MTDRKPPGETAFREFMRRTKRGQELVWSFFGLVLAPGIAILGVIRHVNKGLMLLAVLAVAGAGLIAWSLVSREWRAIVADLVPGFWTPALLGLIVLRFGLDNHDRGMLVMGAIPIVYAIGLGVFVCVRAMRGEKEGRTPR